MKKVILFELNEVPFRVIDKYVAEKPGSRIARIVNMGGAYESHNGDTVQLDPWIAWPTLHRGVVDDQHRIFHLGQHTTIADCKYPPIWQIVKGQTSEVGVFGSLTSSTLPADADDYAFYIPDYFAAEPYANPPSLVPFQTFNLKLTRDSGRNVSRKIPIGLAWDFAKSAMSMGLSFNTVSQGIRQLVGEMFNADRKTRRRSIQPLLMLDLFMWQLQKRKPIFASFYTNHVAAAMHRYWAAYFPEDYAPGEGMPSEWVRRFANEIPAAMDCLDNMLVRLTDFVDRNDDYTLVVASAIGQAAIPTSETKSFLTITDLKRFLALCGLNPADEIKELPAMVPCVSLSVLPSNLASIERTLSSVKIDGKSMVADPRPIGPLSFDINASGTVHVFIQWDNYAGPSYVEMDGRLISFSEAGLGMMAHEDGVNCSAQHVKAGSVLVYDGSRRDSKRGSISSTDLAPSILAHLGLTIPNYMKQSVNLFA